MTGAIFLNDRKEGQSEKAPTHRGSLLIKGKKFKVSGWKRQTKAGANYLSLAIEEDTGERKPKDEW
jgi:uncharacterized protein (DUF736 family)